MGWDLATQDPDLRGGEFRRLNLKAPWQVRRRLHSEEEFSIGAVSGTGKGIVMCTEFGDLDLWVG